MVSSFKRIVMAAFVSTLGCGLTYWWHIKTEPKSLGDSEADIIAYIANTKQETHRKGANNALWEPAEEMDRLRSGDSVRTSGNSEARIKFYRSNRYIDLESDSMIVIQKQESDINLELLEGSLFVNGVDKDSKGALTLKSQDGKVDLSKSAAQLSGSSSNKLDLKVIKGSAQYLKSGGTVESITEGKEGGIGNTGLTVIPEKVKILSPDMTKPVYTNALSPTPLLIQWKGFAPNAQVYLESGSSRKKLSLTPTEKLSPEKMQVNWKPGIYYWKLKAADPTGVKQTVESPIYKTEVIGRFPPTPVAPEPNFVIQTRKKAENITLRWNTPQEYKEVLVELQNDKTKQILFKKRIPAAQDAQDIPNLPLGPYSWRLTAFPDAESPPLNSPSYRFFINEKLIMKIPIAWDANLQPNQFFVNSDPKLSFVWSTDMPDRVHKWKVHIAPEGTDLTKAETFDSLQAQYEKTLSKPGRYAVYITAHDEENENIGTSDVRLFNVQPLPLLTAPTLLPRDSSDFLAKADGSILLRWSPVEEATIYTLVIRDAAGKTISQQNSTAQNLKIMNLMPGTYSVQVGTTDKYGRAGNWAEKRTIQVPDKSEVKAPTLKKIKVN